MRLVPCVLRREYDMKIVIYLTNVFFKLFIMRGETHVSIWKVRCRL
jgi:hypothetical protein